MKLLSTTLRTFALLMIIISVLIVVIDASSKKNTKKTHSFSRIHKNRMYKRNLIKDNQTAAAATASKKTVSMKKDEEEKVDGGEEDGRNVFFSAYKPEEMSHLLIIDNSCSLRNKFKNKHFTRRKVIKDCLRNMKKQGIRKINYCIADWRRGTSKKPKVLFMWQDYPPFIKYKSPINYFGIKQCLTRVAKLEAKLNKKVFTNIHIVTDGYYNSEREFPNQIRGLEPGKIFTADILGEDPKSVDTVREWIVRAGGINKGIRYQLKEVFQ